MSIQEGIPQEDLQQEQLSRRNFLKLGVGATALAALTAIGCGPSGEPLPQPTAKTPETIITPEPEKTPKNLKEWAKKLNIEIGVFANNIMDGRYFDLLLRESNLIVNENFAWNNGNKPLRPSVDSYDFTSPDELIRYTDSKQIPTQGHHLVWWNFLPSWLAPAGGFSGDTNFTRSEVNDILKNHIKTVASHYKGRVSQWSVVNEAIFEGRMSTTFWQRNLGSEYISTAFKTAREADPSAMLIWNENYNEEINANSDFQYNMVRGMLSAGVPIDAIGMQMHLKGINPPNAESIKANIRRFSELGLKVLVTEFDVDMTDVSGSKAEVYDKQAQIYGSVLKAYLDAGGKSFSIFGYSDQYSWYNKEGRPNALATPFDAGLEKKPAYHAMVEVLKNYSEATSLSKK